MPESDNSKFGKLKKVSLGSVWDHETAFSRWLGENIDQLSEQVIWDIDPISVRREVPAWGGSLRVDLLCEATKPGSEEPIKVIIENQFGRTDGGHLSGVIQYTVAFGAGGAVWIAESASSGYMEVVQWLNENTEIDAYLFTIELISIDDSMPVPMLNRVVGPDPALVRKIGGRGASSERSEKVHRWYRRVFPKVAEKCKRYDLWQGFFPTSHGWRRQDVQHEDERVRWYINWYINVMSNRTNVGIYIPNAPRDESHYYFQEVEKKRTEIEDAFGQALRWESTSGYKYIRYGIPTRAGYECTDNDLLEKEADAVADAMASLIAATKGPISELTPYELPADDDNADD